MADVRTRAQLEGALAARLECEQELARALGRSELGVGAVAWADMLAEVERHATLADALRAVVAEG